MLYCHPDQDDISLKEELVRFWDCEILGIKEIREEDDEDYLEGFNGVVTHTVNG